MVAEVQTAQHVWPTLAPVVFVPHAESEYQRLVAVLDALIDVVGENENHPLASLMEVITRKDWVVHYGNGYHRNSR
jgi:HTH-type transcriptional regulator/antitoxin HigA